MADVKPHEKAIHPGNLYPMSAVDGKSAQGDSIADVRDHLRQRKGMLTRSIAKISRLLETKQRGEIVDSFNQANFAAGIFERLYEDFLQSNNFVSDPEFNDQWFIDVVNSVTICNKRVNVFLDSPPSTLNVPSEDSKIIPDSSNHALLPSERVILSAINLPKVEITPFDGDPLHYHTFVRSFMVNVDRLCSDPDSKIARLIAYTRGPARDAISGVQITGGEVGYRRALSRLSELFGSKHLVTQSIITQLACSEPARSPEQVRKLSHQLTNAFDVLSDLSALDEVSSQIIIRALADRLPPLAVNQWENKQLNSKHESGSYLGFKDLVDFVSRIADDMNDPVCGVNAKHMHSLFFNSRPTLSLPAEPIAVCHAINVSNDQPQGNLQRAKLSHANGRKPCSLCGGDHFISRCLNFKKHTISRRVSILRKNKLCFNCLHHDHFATQCRSLYSCLVCNKKHSTFIHTDQLNSSLSCAADFAHVGSLSSDSHSVSCSDAHFNEASLKKPSALLKRRLLSSEYR